MQGDQVLLLRVFFSRLSVVHLLLSHSPLHARNLNQPPLRQTSRHCRSKVLKTCYEVHSLVTLRLSPQPFSDCR